VLLSGVALLPVYTNQGNAIVPFLIGGLALILFAWFHPGVRSAREQAEKSRHPSAAVVGSTEVVDLEEARRRRA
jgi:hypothetical protein